MENKYFDTDMALKLASEPHTFILRAKINTNNLIEVVSKSQEMQLLNRILSRKTIS